VAGKNFLGDEAELLLRNGERVSGVLGATSCRNIDSRVTSVWLRDPEGSEQRYDVIGPGLPVGKKGRGLPAERSGGIPAFYDREGTAPILYEKHVPLTTDFVPTRDLLGAVSTPVYSQGKASRECNPDDHPVVGGALGIVGYICKTLAGIAMLPFVPINCSAVGAGRMASRAKWARRSRRLLEAGN